MTKESSQDIGDLNRASAGYGVRKVRNLGYDPATVESVTLVDGRTVGLENVRAGDHIRTVNVRVENQEVPVDDFDVESDVD